MCLGSHFPALHSSPISKSPSYGALGQRENQKWQMVHCSVSPARGKGCAEVNIRAVVKGTFDGRVTLGLSKPVSPSAEHRCYSLRVDVSVKAIDVEALRLGSGIQ